MNTQKDQILLHMRTKGSITPLVGSRFGTLTVIGEKKVNSRFDCVVRCDCGIQKTMQKGNLQRAKSCGCLTNSLISKARTRHGMTDSPTWKTWKSMLDRCYLREHKSFKDYGSRGISVCPSWHTYENFLVDMGLRPDGLQLDRVNNDLNYAPGNCRWATPKQNCNNRRNSVFLEHNGDRLTIAQWAARLRCDPSALGNRLRNGWSVPEALTRPIKKQRNNRSNRLRPNTGAKSASEPSAVLRKQAEVSHTAYSLAHVKQERVA